MTIVVSYGSSKDEWGTVALIIEGLKHYKHQISAYRTTPGHAKNKDAHRIKLSVIFHAVYIFE